MSEIILLDGGMGQELLARSSSAPTPLWSAQVMMDEPQIVEDVHRAYIDAGARVITINSYSATPERLARAGIGEMFEQLQLRAIDLAKSARKKSCGDIAIAGCLPPLIASYRPELVTDSDWALATYRRIAELQAPHVDVMLCETLSSILEIRAATKAASETGIPVWVAMTLQDGALEPVLRSGEPMAEGIAAAIEEGADVVLANCCWPETITRALVVLASATVPFGVYANGFASVEALVPGGTVKELAARTDLDPSTYADWALKCAERGAAVVGGCCEVGPAHIDETRRALESGDFTIVRSLYA